MADLPTAAPVLVDEAWYLRTYPDVAAAGVDPQQHYLLHGRAEGRLPRPLRALRLEDALWGGFARLALPELQAWLQQTADPDERASAAWALARWYASHSQWQAALPLLGWLESELPPWLDHAGPILLGVEVLLRNGQREQAHAWLREAMVRNRAMPDLCLAAANARLPAGAGGLQPEAILRLGWINAVFTSAGLAPISLRDPLAPLSLDNLHAQSPQVGERAEQAQPKISVIMPAFNAAAFIETALRSLQAQTWQNFEVLVVDDCSSDDTCERVAAMAREDTRILLLRQPRNGGAYAARNAALQRASGEFLVNHDSDDWSHPQRLERMVQPLLHDTTLVATLASWVRTDTSLHFQCWRIEDRLIEPSVSTLMIRKQAVLDLGGWDEVRVAADHELRQRLVHLHGRDAIAHVMPGAPLVFARQLPESLTTASATHLRSALFGLRRLYTELAETWHSMAKDTDLKLVAGQRQFPAPATILPCHLQSTRYDWLLMSDLSACSRTTATVHAVLERLVGADARIALLHWPDYGSPEATVTDALLRLAIRGQLDIVLAEQQLEVEHTLIVGRHLLAYPLDRLPVLDFQRCQVVDALREVRLLPARMTTPLSSQYEKLDTESEPAPHTGQQAASTHAGLPDLFDAQWYLHRYPDVRASGADPWQHYLAHGAAEGRNPGPFFDTAHYLQQCPEARQSGLPALLHYLQAGQQQGIDPSPPSLEGCKDHRSGRPSLLLCAHAANVELFGAERSLLDVLDACERLQLNVVVTVPSVVNAVYIEQLRARARRVICIPTTPWQAGTAPCPHATARFAEVIRHEGIDLIHVNTITLREPLLAARQLQVSALVHVHESPEHDAELANTIGLSAPGIVASVLEQADHVLANSDFTARHFAKPGATHVVPNIIDAATFDLPNPIGPNGLTAGLISSNLPKKGLADIQRLAQALSKRGAAVRLLLIGPENEHVAAIRQAQADGDLPRNLKLRAYTSTPQAAIEQINVLLSLSTCQETFGRTALEAMAAGRPVLAYRMGALPELVEHGISGFLFPAGDIDAVAETLISLSQHPEQILSLGQAGRAKAIRCYGLDRMTESLGRAYSAALAHAAASSAPERQPALQNKAPAWPTPIWQLS